MPPIGVLLVIGVIILGIVCFIIACFDNEQEQRKRSSKSMILGMSLCTGP